MCISLPVTFGLLVMPLDDKVSNVMEISRIIAHFISPKKRLELCIHCGTLIVHALTVGRLGHCYSQILVWACRVNNSKCNVFYMIPILKCIGLCQGGKLR